MRVDYGGSSFLFVGDLMDKGVAALLRQYDENPGVFDADVLLASHHGAKGDTTDPFVDLVSPQVAVISMGTQQGTGSRSARAYGHPNLSTLDVLQDEPSVVSDPRSTTEFWGSPARRTDFQSVAIDRAIFGTGWEGTVIVTATGDGQFDVETLGF